MAQAAEVEETSWVSAGQMGLSFLSSKSYLERIMNPAAALAIKCAQTSQLNSRYLPAKSLGFVPLNVFVLVGVYGIYWHLTWENPHTSWLVFVEKREVFTETFASVFHRKESIVFLGIEISLSAGCWLTSWVHAYIPVSLFLHGTASSESESF